MLPPQGRAFSEIEGDCFHRKGVRSVGFSGVGFFLLNVNACTALVWVPFARYFVALVSVVCCTGIGFIVYHNVFVHTVLNCVLTHTLVSIPTPP